MLNIPVFGNTQTVNMNTMMNAFTRGVLVSALLVADNLRKGAATNAVQIAELLVAKNLV